MTTTLPIDRIVPNPENIRSQLRGMDELVAAVREVGILHPITVTPRADGRFRIIDGHRRYEAARRVGLQVIPVIARRTRTGIDHTFLMLIAALHDPLTPLEEAAAFAKLRDAGVPFVDIARKSGRSAGTVRDRLALLRLPEEARAMLDDGRLPLSSAVDLARGVTTGTPRAVPARTDGRRTGWFTKTHRLADAVRAACTHRGTRQMVGGIGCGQCWEDAITEDASQRPDSVVPFRGTL
ncbi:MULTISPECIES: ParB/RepB/Spo0J family partition protein [unclassified Cellulomonas]|uniref:ParB/RepB/Spo0J family partition protein n=1 Tax=unclassified Cellulomonas TaxID=2620175 RepID=UPI001C4FD12F|nr:MULTISPECIES: ParB/RepB/Spo0J family partition protein [unclassified Cellulomonas]MBW0254420.1 ParB/RepB/Spo0J family partition protein [Cellulomonas sp. PS-H5]MCG7284648.1 ParB/RepB/Spo0J family partition protein [Cellulomonas sp. ACRRI]